FQAALLLTGRQSQLTAVVVAENSQALTPFEAKYQASGQQCWQLLYH
ncbi:MAG: SAM-dependent methyltransferase, partial [Alteromonadaceae bacterium]|nr:SAM-dependent methyltransferase [Alteromonadaceae bacterium]